MVGGTLVEHLCKLFDKCLDLKSIAGIDVVSSGMRLIICEILPGIMPILLHLGVSHPLPISLGCRWGVEVFIWRRCFSICCAM